MRQPFSVHPGDKIAGYTVLAQAGSGGSGQIFRVRDISGGIFILKLVPSGRNEELASVEQYRKLPPHPGITVIHGAGETSDGRLYYLMDAADNLREDPEYLPDTLANRLAVRGPMKAQEVLVLAERLLEAVRHLHRNGMGHFDIKPENVIFCSGEPKLADFGSLSPCSGSGIPRGTPGFFPEEELGASVNGGFSGKNDLYALGMTLYCAWSGHAPDEFPSLPELPDREGMATVRKLCLRACDPSPSYRFQSADAFLHAVLQAEKKLQPRSRMRYLPFFAACFAVIVLFCALYLGKGEKLTETQIARIRSAEGTARMAETEHVLEKQLAVMAAMTPEERKESRIEESVRELQRLRDFSIICSQWRKDPSSSRLRKEMLASLERCPLAYHASPQGFRAMSDFIQRMHTLAPEETAFRDGRTAADPETRKRFAELCFQLRMTADPYELVRIRREMRSLMNGIRDSR